MHKQRIVHSLSYKMNIIIIIIMIIIITWLFAIYMLAI